MSDDRWDAAFAALMRDEDPKPLGELIGSTDPIPTRIRSYLRSLMVGDDLAFVDRLGLIRSDRTRRSIQTNDERIELGRTLADLMDNEGKTLDGAIKELQKTRGVSESKLEKTVRRFRTLPAVYGGRPHKRSKSDCTKTPADT